MHDDETEKTGNGRLPTNTIPMPRPSSDLPAD